MYIPVKGIVNIAAGNEGAQFDAAYDEVKLTPVTEVFAIVCEAIFRMKR